MYTDLVYCILKSKHVDLITRIIKIKINNEYIVDKTLTTS